MLTNISMALAVLIGPVRSCLRCFVHYLICIVLVHGTVLYIVCAQQRVISSPCPQSAAFQSQFTPSPLRHWPCGMGPWKGVASGMALILSDFLVPWKVSCRWRSSANCQRLITNAMGLLYCVVMGPDSRPHALDSITASPTEYMQTRSEGGVRARMDLPTHSPPKNYLRWHSDNSSRRQAR